MHRTSIAATLVSALFLLLLAGTAAPLVAQAGGGCHAPADGSVYMEGDGNTVIRMDTCSFAPTANRVPVGTTVRFLNTATLPHQVVGRSATWGSVLLEPGQEHSETFAAAGVYPYTCPLHPGMVGAILVGDGAAKAQAADLAVATQPTDPAPTQPDTTPLVLAGLLGLGIGIALGVAVARVRPRTTS